MDRDTNILSDGGDAGLGTSPHVFCLEGKTLAEALAECRTARERLRLLPQYASLCDAVGAAHSRGVIHRGLHPGAVLLSDYGETVISDWSLSKVRGRPDQQRDRFGEAAAGGPLRPYLAPEIVKGRFDEVDARSDVYALGAILYQVLTGKPPRSDGGAAEPADTVEAEVPRELVQICRRAMFQEASARYANASKLADTFRQVETQAGPAAPDRPAGRVDPLYKTLLGAAVLCLVVLAAGFGFVYHGLSVDRAEAVIIRDKEIDLRRDAEEARDKLAEELKDADMIRTRIESDRDRFEDALATARGELEQVRAELKTTQEELITAQGAAKRAETIARLSGAEAETAETAAESAPEPEEPVAEQAAPEPQEEPAVEGPVEAFSTPLPELELSAEEPAETAAPEEAAPAPTEEAPPAPPEEAAAAPTPPAPKPGGIEKPDFGKAMPDLIASVVTVEGAESRAVIRITDTTPPAIKAMGFRDGDVITRINRNPITTVDEAKRALINVQKDTGFSIRITRNGRTGWMRVNFAPPPAPPVPVQPTQPEQAAAEPAQPQPPAGEAEPPADEAEPIEPEPEPANQ
ncbi:MAG: protein kinase [Candidatus Hydrogenedentes bacterium]|nr:protein kinase [Candidatus Hydrogenedentota bacterium]